MEQENKQTQQLGEIVKFLERRGTEAKAKYQALKIVTDQQHKELRALVLSITDSPAGEKIVDYTRRLQKCFLEILKNLQVYTDRRASVDSYTEEIEKEEDRQARLMASLPQFENN